MLRDWWKGRVAQPRSKTDQFQQLTADIEQLKAHAEQVDSNFDVLSAGLDTLNNGLTAREEKLRKWVLTLLLWNAAITLGLLALAALALRR